VRDHSDADLIKLCLEGDGDAWEALVHRYKRLVYSIPYKWGLSREDAMEIFQSVWLDCFQELRLLRDVERLQAWLVRIAVRKCYRLSQKNRGQGESVEVTEANIMTGDPGPEMLRRLDHEQLIRSAVNKLSPRCKQVIDALFFEEPFPTYAGLAHRLGLSSNSIGFTRDRCLERLGALLEDLGYQH
jgi:RNA polymerase sigma factor (sigma-70 family)